MQHALRLIAIESNSFERIFPGNVPKNHAFSARRQNKGAEEPVVTWSYEFKEHSPSYSSCVKNEE